MIIIGHPDIPYEPFYYVETIEEIAQTPSGATLWLGPYRQTVELARHCHQNGLPYGVMAESLTDALLANALGARYILASEPLASKVQKAAETYLFDAKVLVPVTDESDMEAVAQVGVDGIIFPQAIAQH
ncbi:hypothetical protein [Hydrogenimonas sp.]